MIRPISFIMRTDPKDLEPEDLKAGIEHIDRMLHIFQEHRKSFEQELKRQGGPSDDPS